MKKIFTTLVCAFAVCAAASAQSQRTAPVSCPVSDTVLLSADVDGTYLVRKYLVKQRYDQNSDYAVRYQVDAAQLSSTLAGNARQLNDLRAFVDKASQDKAMQVTGVTITGYASPDGPYAPNERLARKRATDFRNYVDSNYHLSARYPITVSAVVDEWKAAVPAVETSAIPSKAEVLQILNSSDKATVKEMRLKRLPAAWNYMRQHILPPMRHVEMAFAYDKSSVITERTPIPLPELQPVINTTYIIVDDQPDGVIIDMDEFDCSCAM